MPYRSGFLTDRWKRYLEKDRKEIDAGKRAVYDFYLRETLKQSLKDLVFVLGLLDKKQFDKISRELYTDLVHLVTVFCKSSYVDGFVRIKKYRDISELVFKDSAVTENFESFCQNVLNNLYGKDKMRLVVMDVDTYDVFLECMKNP